MGSFKRTVRLLIGEAPQVGSREVTISLSSSGDWSVTSGAEGGRVEASGRGESLGSAMNQARKKLVAENPPVSCGIDRWMEGRS